MGRGGTGLASCASAWSGAAVISKKDRHFIAPGTLPSIAMSQVAPSSRSREVIRNRAAELGRSSGRTAIVGKLVKNARQATPGHRLNSSMMCGDSVNISVSYNDSVYYLTRMHSSLTPTPQPRVGTR
jgi:hypothetical protein